MSRRDGGVVWSSEGVTLRDLFAASATAGLLAGHRGMLRFDQADLSKIAYGYADALLNARAGDSAWTERATRVQVAVEDLKATSEILWPGQDAQSKMCKLAALEALFDVRSWTAVEQLSAEVIEGGAINLRRMEGLKESISKDRAILILEIRAVMRGPV